MRFQRVTLAAILRGVGYDRRWNTWLAVTPDRSGPWPQRFRIVPQGHGNLGQRMESVAQSLPPGPVVIIGADIPEIRARHIARAFRVLERCDVVFGPASDGGYWLVGLRRHPRFVNPFHGVRWSSEYALADTLRNLPSRKVLLVDTLADVDDGASLRRYSRSASIHRR